jgi:hypothetical protein
MVGAVGDLDDQAVGGKRAAYFAGTLGHPSSRCGWCISSVGSTTASSISAAGAAAAIAMSEGTSMSMPWEQLGFVGAPPRRIAADVYVVGGVALLTSDIGAGCRALAAVGQGETAEWCGRSAASPVLLCLLDLASAKSSFRCSLGNRPPSTAAG